MLAVHLHHEDLEEDDASGQGGVAEKRAVLRRYEELAANYSDETAAEFAKLQDQIDAQNLWELDRQLEIAMDALRCPPGDAEVATISGGERRRVALCQVLLRQPDLLLLGETTNHLDAESVAWLERHLQEYTGTVVAITHDRYFLDNAAQWILELDRGEGIPGRATTRHYVIFVGVALLSIVLAELVVGLRYGVPGWTYSLLGPLCGFHGAWSGRRRRRLQSV